MLASKSWSIFKLLSVKIMLLFLVNTVVFSGIFFRSIEFVAADVSVRSRDVSIS